MTFYQASHKHDEWVEFTEGEIVKANEHGLRLFNLSRQRAWDDREGIAGTDAHRLHIQQIGVLAEIGVAKALDLTWTPQVDNIRRGPDLPDLPHNIETRLIGVNRYGLRVYEEDPEERRIVGIVIPRGGECQPCRLPGWTNAVYAQKHPEWAMDPNYKGRPFFSMPQENLFPLSTLRDLIAQE